jgi:hypothetical protein
MELVSWSLCSFIAVASLFLTELQVDSLIIVTRLRAGRPGFDSRVSQ